MLDRARRFVVFPAAVAAFALLLVGGLLSCMEGKRVADPNCLFIASDVTDDPGLPLDPPPGTVALVYSPNVRDGGVSTDIEPAFDVVVYGPLTKSVYSIAFHLQYDATILQYGGRSEGSVFDDAVCYGDCTEFQVDSTTEEGKLLVSLTRRVPACGDCADCADCVDCADCADCADIDCANDIDDDGDTFIDEFDCVNGIDDDGDTLIDEADCTNFIDDDGDIFIDEFDCNNGIDDDGDGSTDEADCSNGIDDDGDILIDEFDCINDSDDDGDTLIDEADCSNGIDDDGDGLTDETACDDCVTSNCTDVVDNDGDGLIDELDGAICNDCITSDCSNGSDDDGDGSTDETVCGVDFAAGANVVMTLGFEPTAEGGPSPFGFVGGTLELKDPSGVDLNDPATDWFAGSTITTREECL
ncbi:MAG: hypothetical protein JSV08_05295 [Acidobacteriota bacterium]|nr:MAG: hypothetical protein JSV08_05295 [Acidobacteriota bacterium]